jgi:hypothetical protein
MLPSFFTEIFRNVLKEIGKVSKLRLGAVGYLPVLPARELESAFV